MIKEEDSLLYKIRLFMMDETVGGGPRRRLPSSKMNVIDLPQRKAREMLVYDDTLALLNKRVSKHSSESDYLLHRINLNLGKSGMFKKGGYLYGSRPCDSAPPNSTASSVASGLSPRRNDIDDILGPINIVDVVQEFTHETGKKRRSQKVKQRKVLTVHSMEPITKPLIGILKYPKSFEEMGKVQQSTTANPRLGPSSVPSAVLLETIKTVRSFASARHREISGLSKELHPEKTSEQQNKNISIGDTEVLPGKVEATLHLFASNMANSSSGEHGLPYGFSAEPFSEKFKKRKNLSLSNATKGVKAKKRNSKTVPDLTAASNMSKDCSSKKQVLPVDVKQYVKLSKKKKVSWAPINNSPPLKTGVTNLTPLPIEPKNSTENPISKASGESKEKQKSTSSKKVSMMKHFNFTRPEVQVHISENVEEPLKKAKKPKKITPISTVSKKQFLLSQSSQFLNPASTSGFTLTRGLSGLTKIRQPLVGELNKKFQEDIVSSLLKKKGQGHTSFSPKIPKPTTSNTNEAQIQSTKRVLPSFFTIVHVSPTEYDTGKRIPQPSVKYY